MRAPAREHGSAGRLPLPSPGASRPDATEPRRRGTATAMSCTLPRWRTEMADDTRPVSDLLAYKAMLVATRRRLVALGVHGNKNAVRAPGAAYEAAIGPSTSRSAEVRALQDDIDAVNRAIRDEQHDAAG